MSACAFAASIPTIIAKTLKLPMRACFMIFSFGQDMSEQQQRTLIE
jgi:hypothetical protein